MIPKSLIPPQSEGSLKRLCSAEPTLLQQGRHEAEALSIAEQAPAVATLLPVWDNQNRALVPILVSRQLRRSYFGNVVSDLFTPTVRLSAGKGKKMETLKPKALSPTCKETPMAQYLSTMPKHGFLHCSCRLCSCLVTPGRQTENPFLLWSQSKNMLNKKT